MFRKCKKCKCNFVTIAMHDKSRSMLCVIKYTIQIGTTNLHSVKAATILARIDITCLLRADLNHCAAYICNKNIEANYFENLYYSSFYLENSIKTYRHFFSFFFNIFIFWKTCRTKIIALHTLKISRTNNMI